MRQARDALRRLRWRWQNNLYAVCASVRSLYGHIDSQLSKGIRSVNLARALESAPAQIVAEHDKRQLARASYIEMLSATQGDWLDIVDLHIFLSGFDAGEQYALHIRDMGSDTHFDGETWLTLAEKRYGSVPDKIKRLMQTEVLGYSIDDPLAPLPSPESRATFDESGRSCTKRNTESPPLSGSPVSSSKHSSTG